MTDRIHLSQTFTKAELDEFQADLKTQSAFPSFLYKTIADHLAEPDLVDALPPQTLAILTQLLPLAAKSHGFGERIWAFFARFEGHVLTDKERLQ